MADVKDVILEFIKKRIMPEASKEILKDIQEYLEKAKAKAKKTKNPFDDILVMLLQSIFGKYDG